MKNGNSLAPNDSMTDNELKQLMNDWRSHLSLEAEINNHVTQLMQQLTQLHQILQKAIAQTHQLGGQQPKTLQPLQAFSNKLSVASSMQSDLSAPVPAEHPLSQALQELLSSATAMYKQNTANIHELDANLISAHEQLENITILVNQILTKCSLLIQQKSLLEARIIALFQQPQGEA